MVLTAVFRWARRAKLGGRHWFWRSTWLLIQVAWWTLLAHLAEIAVWAGLYFWKDLFSSFEISFYFSLVTYSTVGYGDVVAPPHWSNVAAVEGLVGILLCGWSTGSFFAIANRMFLTKDKDDEK